MTKLIEYWIEALISKLVPRAIREVIGRLLLICWGIFSVYNLYSLFSSGLVFLIISRQRSGWFTFDENPINFVILTGIYSISVVPAVLAIHGYFVEKRRIRRTVLKEFTDGSGPAPIRRPWNQR